MVWIGRLIKSFFKGLLLWVALAVGWGAFLMVAMPWQEADPPGWHARHPIVVTDGSGQTSVMPWREYQAAQQRDPNIVPWPTQASGMYNGPSHDHSNGISAEWTSPANKPWRFEVQLTDRDYITQVRYRLDGETPVLVQVRERGPQVAFMSMPLALITLIALRVVAWWRSRRAKRQTV